MGQASDVYTHVAINTNSTYLSGIHMDSFGIQHVVGYLGLPISGGLSLGLISGFIKG